MDLTDWQRLLSARRLGRDASQDQAPARTSFQRDYDRLIFADPFRRLADKTQVFPLPDDDHVHSRMTHSLEAACVGRSLGNLVGGAVVKDLKSWERDNLDHREFGDVVGTACLAHDIGNPPFGHSGEQAVGRWFRRHREQLNVLAGGDESAFKARHPWLRQLDADPHLWSEFADFEGNAQGFRILVRHQAERQGGMQLTCAALATFTKYPRLAFDSNAPPEAARYKKHGIFKADRQFFEKVAAETGLVELADGVWARHPLAYLVEAADDICYGVVDVEDGFRLGYLSFDEAIGGLLPLAERNPVGDLSKHENLRKDDKRAFVEVLRAYAINALIYSACDVFLTNKDQLVDGRQQSPLLDHSELAGELEAIKDLAFKKCYRAADVVAVELTGFHVIAGLLDIIEEAVFTSSTYSKKALDVFKHLRPNGTEYEKLLAVTDFVSGMTDTYAVNVYRRVLGMEFPGGRRALA